MKNIKETNNYKLYSYLKNNHPNLLPYYNHDTKSFTFLMNIFKDEILDAILDVENLTKSTWKITFSFKNHNVVVKQKWWLCSIPYKRMQGIHIQCIARFIKNNALKCLNFNFISCKVQFIHNHIKIETRVQILHYLLIITTAVYNNVRILKNKFEIRIQNWKSNLKTKIEIENRN